MAANYYFWISALEPTIQETAENKDKGPRDGCKSFNLSDVQFAYPLAPQKRVLKGISLTVSQRKPSLPKPGCSAETFRNTSRSNPESSSPSSVHRAVEKAR